LETFRFARGKDKGQSRGEKKICCVVGPPYGINKSAKHKRKEEKTI